MCYVCFKPDEMSNGYLNIYRFLKSVDKQLGAELVLNQLV